MPYYKRRIEKIAVMKEKIDLIIFGGQSNMQGQSERLSNCNVVENAYEYRFLGDELIPLCNPVGENIKVDRTPGIAHQKGGDGQKWLREHVTGGSASGNTNMVPEFCKAYNGVTGTKVVAVHAAKGSTQIDYWLPGTFGYQFVVDKAKAAIEKATSVYEVGRIFFVWLQGESDALARVMKEEYMEKLVCLNQGLKESLGIETFGIIRVGRFTKDERDQEIIDAQDEICEKDGDFTMLTDMAAQMSEEAQYMNPYVPGHFSAEGLELLGKTAGEALGRKK